MPTNTTTTTNKDKVRLEYIKTLTPIVVAIISLVGTCRTKGRVDESEKKASESEATLASLVNGLADALGRMSSEGAEVAAGIQNPAATGTVTTPASAPSAALVEAVKADDPAAALTTLSFDPRVLDARDLRAQLTKELNRRSERILTSIPRRP